MEIPCGRQLVGATAAVVPRACMKQAPARAQPSCPPASAYSRPRTVHVGADRGSSCNGDENRFAFSCGPTLSLFPRNRSWQHELATCRCIHLLPKGGPTCSVRGSKR